VVLSACHFHEVALATSELVADTLGNNRLTALPKPADRADFPAPICYLSSISILQLSSLVGCTQPWLTNLNPPLLAIDKLLESALCAKNG